MNKAERMIGMCARAGQLVSGSFSVEKAIKTGKANLVIIAEDASDETKKGLKDACAFYQTKCIVMGTKESLGGLVGKEYRACLAIMDENFANVIQAAVSTCESAY